MFRTQVGDISLTQLGPDDLPVTGRCAVDDVVGRPVVGRIIFLFFGKTKPNNKRKSLSLLSHFAVRDDL
jgi:hypothetical protein